MGSVDYVIVDHSITNRILLKVVSEGKVINRITQNDRVKIVKHVARKRFTDLTFGEITDGKCGGTYYMPHMIGLTVFGIVIFENQLFSPLFRPRIEI